jgi:O-acetylhomoserine/O-acetylserine sulfhydrylase-like pyridoxal-dependent enzyme
MPISNKYQPETQAIRLQRKRTAELEHSTPLFLTSSFVYESAEDMAAAFTDDSLDVNIYSRFSNPTVDEFIDKVCALEGAEDGVATGTGMAAVFATFMTFLGQGDHILSASAVFGSTHTILTKYLPKWGISSTYFDMNSPETIEALILPNTKMLYVETPSNPGLDIIDLAFLGEICKKYGILYVVDNCLHADNALKVAKALEGHAKLSFVKYPFLPTHPQYDIAQKQMSNGGGILTFELKGGLDAGRTFLNALEMISMTNNLGDSRTIASHPASTTHSKLSESERAAVGITLGLVRVSVGLEHADDIINDIMQALEQC